MTIKSRPGTPYVWNNVVYIGSDAGTLHALAVACDDAALPKLNQVAKLAFGLDPSFASPDLVNGQVHKDLAQQFELDADTLLELAPRSDAS